MRNQIGENINCITQLTTSDFSDESLSLPSPTTGGFVEIIIRCFKASGDRNSVIGSSGFG